MKIEDINTNWAIDEISNPFGLNTKGYKYAVPVEELDNLDFKSDKGPKLDLEMGAGLEFQTDKSKSKVIIPNYNPRESNLRTPNYNPDIIVEDDNKINLKDDGGPLKDDISSYKKSIIIEHTDELKFLLSKEGKDNSYTTKNRAGSSAYGKYQFMPSTAKMYAKEIGINPNEWNTPDNQDKIMAHALKAYGKVLDSVGVKHTHGNKYAVHQLGPARARRFFRGKLTTRDIKVMNDNLPRSKKVMSLNRNTVISRWRDTYLK